MGGAIDRQYGKAGIVKTDLGGKGIIDGIIINSYTIKFNSYRGFGGENRGIIFNWVSGEIVEGAFLIIFG